MEQLEQRFAGWGLSKKNKEQETGKKIPRKRRLDKPLLKIIMTLGCMKVVNLDTESQPRMSIKIFLFVKLRL